MEEEFELEWVNMRDTKFEQEEQEKNPVPQDSDVKVNWKV